MNFSTNRAPGAPITSNVSRTADLAFLAELKRTDRDRYNRLLDAMQREAYRLRRKSSLNKAFVFIGCFWALRNRSRF